MEHTKHAVPCRGKREMKMFNRTDALRTWRKRRAFRSTTPGRVLMSFDWEARHLRDRKRVQVWASMRDPNSFAPHDREQKPIPPGPVTELLPGALPPFTDLVEIDCQDCGGKGFDPGSVNPHEPEDCLACHGSGKETILRNYLAEAFRIAADPETKLQLERAHLVALTAYARQTVSALLSLPEVA
jgi:hypothetical protein